MFSIDDHRFMSEAIRLADLPVCSPHPNPRVGCVIVKDGKVLGKGYHRQAGGAHAEVSALSEAGADAEGSTVYVTLEPCCHHGKTPPCSDALVKAKVSKLVVALEDPNPLVAGQGIQQLRDQGIEVRVGLLRLQSESLNPGFIKRMTSQRPFVRCKVAMSLDGRTAMATGESQWITEPTARRDVQKWRARSAAMLTGIGTVLADNPFLNLRESELGTTPTQQPIRVVVDSELRTPVTARLFSVPGRVIIATTSRNESRRAGLQAAGAEILQIPDFEGGIDLTVLLHELAKLEINEVMVEAGKTLNGALLRAKLIDQLIVYMAPILMGDAAAGMMHLPGVISMEQKINLSITEVRPIGRDWRFICTPSV